MLCRGEGIKEVTVSTPPYNAAPEIISNISYKQAYT